MAEVTILTGIDTFVLDDDAARELLAHIRSEAGTNREAAEQPLLTAIDSQDADPVRWSDDGKHGALRAIDHWLISEAERPMPGVVGLLRYELMRDLGLPPFDELEPVES
jgi:hypothetical protein